MGKRTGQPRGRPKGATNKIIRQRQEKLEAAARQIEDALPEAFKGDAHALLMAIYKDTKNELEIRIDAAKAAIGYEKPRLANTTIQNKTVRSVDELSTAELLAALQSAADREGIVTEEGSYSEPDQVH